MKTGFIGLGAVGGKLAGNLLQNGTDLAVHDLDAEAVARFAALGATAGGSPAALMRDCEVVITSLPSPAASETVLTEMLPHMAPGKIWIEMSTTDPEVIEDQARRVAETGGTLVEAPVSGGCHRAATGNISVFAGGSRDAFERVLPLLTILGRKVLHTGEIGTASRLKVMTNYLATANLLTLMEALTTMKAAGLDLATTYEAIAISSGTSFVHETESQLILSGSRDVDFTLDLVAKDVGLFQAMADDAHVPLTYSPMILQTIREAQEKLGVRAQSDRMIELLEDLAGVSVLAEGFPQELVDEEPPARGAEWRPLRG